MRIIDESLVSAIAKIDPLTLAILFIGLISLGVIWLASVIVKNIRPGHKQ